MKIKLIMDKVNLIENLGNRGEKLINSNLHERENIELKIKGTYGEAVVLTNKRLYVLKWGYFAGSFLGGRSLGFEFKDITGVELKTGILTGTLEILTPATQNAQKSIWGTGNRNATTSDNVVTFTRDMFDKFKESVKVIRGKINQTSTKTKSEGSIHDLEKLAQLKDKGIITKEEFEAKKKQILGL